MKSSQGLASDTLVRTTTGAKRVGDVQVDDYLYDAGNRPTLCTGVAPPATDQLKKIMYHEFDSSEWTSFTCTPDHRLTLTTTGTRPCISGNRVFWFTRCDRQLPVKEACDLHLDILSDYFYQDLVRGDNHPEPATVHAYIETARETIHTSMDIYLDVLSSRRAEADEVDSMDKVFQDVGSTDEVFSIDELNQLTGDLNVPSAEYSLPEEPFVQWDLASSQSTHSYVPSSQPPPPDGDPRSSSPLSDSSSAYLDNAHADRFAAVRKSLDSINCDCGGLRRVGRRFKTEEQMQLALKILQGDLHHLVDPLIVNDGEEFSMTIGEYERLCSKEVKRLYLKLYRTPLVFHPSTLSAGPQALLVDPYFLGLWLGDGDAANTRITSSDPETPVWLKSYVDRLNSSKQPDDNLYLAETLTHAAGTVMANGYRSNCDVFQYRIACLQLRPGKTNNPVLDGLRRLGLLGNKNGGIPHEYMAADEDTRLAVIAGLIDSDGSYNKRDNNYRFTQATDGHRKIVYDLKELALSCGISVTGVSLHMTTSPFTAENPHTPVYAIYLGKGSEKFQKHLLIPRKKMTGAKTYYSHDARPFKVVDAPAGEYTALEVRGGQFQLANRLVVYN
ncbi:hypothetical protein POJ06DRAFT_296709 [Lipomyces tetrasporus]|uniref:DOD-type homing endonuclease domain-containing protein n=1 Tax=Lipomyces tetrasporus TaxID=54092 RepID=A0AAD7VPT0_9ASCO|nr:uncharacterized protein POJ06DRAFT_296709 [Lipomyces tetrasporus]KAJ8098152.1 hypothetical protein POJ06DRAFT_296709 [Lipomyces tetrasporus]